MEVVVVDRVADHNHSDMGLGKGPSEEDSRTMMIVDEGVKEQEGLHPPDPILSEQDELWMRMICSRLASQNAGS